jgi:hypothetical protein
MSNNPNELLQFWEIQGNDDMKLKVLSKRVTRITHDGSEPSICRMCQNTYIA